MSEIDKVLDDYLNGAKEIFPHLKISSRFSMFSGELEFPTSGKIELNNKIFEIDISEEKPYEVIHYTSLNAFLEIINSLTIRMYNCYNLNDPKEIEHSFETMNFPYTDESIKNWKRNHFVLSFSKYDRTINDDFNMWRLYGQNGMGVGLVFEVPKEINNWRNVTINEIEYTSKNKPSKIKQYIDYHQNFQEKNPVFENTPSIIPLLATFHKNEIWSGENEIRLVAHCPYDEYTLEAKTFDVSSSDFLNESLNHSINSNGTPVAYIQIPISKKTLEDKIIPEWDEDLKNHLMSNHPFLQLKSVVIGPQLVHSSSFGPLIHFMDIAYKKTGVGLEIIHSKHSKLYRN